MLSTVITKQPNGQRLIFSPRTFPKLTAHFDKAWTHAFNPADAGATEALTCASGLTAFFSFFKLKDGLFYNYLWQAPVLYPPNPATFDAYNNFEAPNIGGHYTGESFNYVLRPLSTLKLTNADLIIYQATH